MDSVTQLTLGAAVGEAVLGRKAGTKAPLWGAFFGTLPDLDVLANPFLTEVQALGFHRSITHSLLFMVLVAPLAGAALQRLHDDASWKSWAALVFAALSTHVLLDCFTAYGTQVFYPFSRYPVIFGTIFVIDPVYTLLLGGGLVMAMVRRSTAPARRWWNAAGLALSTGYLLLTIVHKAHVESVFARALSAQGKPSTQVFTRPTPFNNLLWMGLVEGRTGYWVGYYSLWDAGPPTRFRFVPKRHHLLKQEWDAPAVQRLRWFSRGYFAVSQRDGRTLVHDLRFGRNDVGLTAHGRYIFTFRLRYNDARRVTGFHQLSPPLSLSAPLLRAFAARIVGRKPPYPFLPSTGNAPGGS
ncbi:metal-dependent hydrolase [Salisaeta longa]|uniref:metal-dependent hydrolase n=1 Tax=Salisaeta longa TaxID=503170 RepID=UPI0003B4990A|nr:metal-dependent hydrolase [Salisaeta longa]